ILDRIQSHTWPLPLRIVTETGAEPPSTSSSTSPYLSSFGSDCGLQLLESHQITTTEELSLVHPASYIAAVRATCQKLREPTLVDDSTYLVPESYDDCCRAVHAARLRNPARFSPAPIPL
ncbi:hypothetical protein VaNZ11_015928, partial [Volvox africanus]